MHGYLIPRNGPPVNADLPLVLADDAQPRAASDGDRQSLYRAYRSLTFGEIAGQSHVTRTLRNAVVSGTVAHAYLFTGPRGTGKTSTARILARAANCLQPRQGEPCNACAICTSMLERRSLDLIEIDGASNNSVDDVRELRDRVNFRPAAARRKVFIIDEVHMLSIGAFNALLKTLEEPPEHVLFVLATTEVHKVPATVTSRCQRFDLRPVPLPEMVRRLSYVCAHEGMSAGEDVLRFIAAQSTGSLRDALSLLEQIRAYCGDTLNLQDVESALGLARTGQVAGLADAIAAGDLGAALLGVGDLIEYGIDPRQLARQLSGYWRDALEGRARGQLATEPHVAPLRADQMVPVLRSLLSVESTTRRSDSPRWALELAVAEATLALAGVSGRTADEAVYTAGVAAPQGRSGRVPDPVRANGATVAVPRSGRPEPVAPAPQPMPADHVTPDLAAPPVEATVGAGETAPRLPEPSMLDLPTAPEAPLADTQMARMPEPDGCAGDEQASVDAPHAEALESGKPDETPLPYDSVVAAQASGEMPGAIAPDAAPLTTEDVRERWPAVLRWLDEQRKTNVKTYLGGTSAQGISVDGETVVIGFPGANEFYRTQLERPGNRAVLVSALEAALGGRWNVRCVTITGLTPPPSAEDFELFAADAEQTLRERKRRMSGS